MKNLGPIILLFVFLTHKNIILLNEEFLIFLSFVTFVILIVYKIGPSIRDNFRTESKEIHNNLQKSIEEVSRNLKKIIKQKETFSTLFLIYKTFINYFYKLSSISNRIIESKSRKDINNHFNTQLIFIKKVEDQTLKLFTIILLEKINKIFVIKKFCDTKFDFQYFKSLQKIQIRESLNKISSED